MNKKSLLKKGNIVVIKVGTALISENGKPRKKFITELARQINYYNNCGIKVVIVSSGAVGTGMGILGLQKRPKLIREHQAVASVGQAGLIDIYRKIFDAYDIKIAQILLTSDDLSNRRRHLNAKNTIDQLFNWEIIPVINENDTVVVEELKFGDNDRLASLVSIMIDAELLIMMTNVDGLLDNDNNLIESVKEITPEIKKLARGPGTETSLGGMKSKIKAVSEAVKSGIGTYIINGNKENILIDLLNRKKEGTFFHPDENKISSRKKWIAFHSKKNGEIIIDDGAVSAVVRGNKSLLPSGIIEVRGKFERGDSVNILDENSNVLGNGLVLYNSSEILKIRGKQSKEINTILGYTHGSEIIHKNYLIIMH